jgi:hypothetical protein
MRQRRIKTAKRGQARDGLDGCAVVAERATLARAPGSGSWLGVAPGSEVTITLSESQAARGAGAQINEWLSNVSEPAPPQLSSGRGYNLHPRVVRHASDLLYTFHRDPLVNTGIRIKHRRRSL